MKGNRWSLVQSITVTFIIWTSKMTKVLQGKSVEAETTITTRTSTWTPEQTYITERNVRLNGTSQSSQYTTYQSTTRTLSTEQEPDEGTLGQTRSIAESVRRTKQTGQRTRQPTWRTGGQSFFDWLLGEAGPVSPIWRLDFLGNIRKSIKDVIKKLPAFDLTSMSDEDASRMLMNFANLPAYLQNKLMNVGGLVNLTTEELMTLPVDIIACQITILDDSNITFAVNKMVKICQKMMDKSCPPQFLTRSLNHGIHCETLLGRLPSTLTESKSKAVVLMERIKETANPADWSSQQFMNIIRHLGTALTTQDIQAIPDYIIQESLNNISSVHIPRKSTRRNLCLKLTNRNRSPTEWSEDILNSMGRLLEEIDLDQLQLLNKDVVLNAVEGLTEAQIHKDSTRISLAKSILEAIPSSPTSDLIQTVLPWLKSDFRFMKGLDLDNLLRALTRTAEDFGKLESSLIAERFETDDNFRSAIRSNDSSDAMCIFGRLIDGFSVSYVDGIASEKLIELLSCMKPLTSRIMAKHIHQKLMTEIDTISDDFQIDLCALFNGFDLRDIENMSEEDVIVCMETIKQLDLPEYIGRKLVKKIAPTLIGNITYLDDVIQVLGKYTRYISVQLLRGSGIIPDLAHDGQNKPNLDDGYMTKPQLFAVIDNIRERLSATLTDGSPIFTAAVIGQLGDFLLGLTAQDIFQLPIDLDLLSVIEILTKYEDKLDSSQVEAIVAKLREYFQISDKNVLDNVDEIMILQTGRFLQYLNSDYELVKFPTHLRPVIVEEIGKSSLMGIPYKKRQALLKFALKNTNVGGENELEEYYLERPIDADMLMDLGSLKCGLTDKLIHKLTADAINVHIEDLQKCPFKRKEMSAVVNRAIHYNVNRLKSRDHLSSMGQLLLELPDSDFNLIDSNELATVAEYIVKSILANNIKMETIEKKGFIRERSSQEELERTEKIKRLSESLLTAMERVFGVSSECQIVMRLQDISIFVSEMIEPDKLERCIEFIGSLKWDSATARSLLNRMGDLLEVLGPSADEPYERFRFILSHASSLLPGLPAQEFNRFNFTVDDISRVGELEMLTEEQMKNGFNRWLDVHDMSAVSGDDIANMKYLACGATPQYIRDHVLIDSFRSGIATLGKVVRKCNREQLKAYAEKVETVLDGTSDAWPLHDIVEIGSLLGGLNKDKLSSLTKWQIKVIEPEVITNMPEYKIKEFTIQQIEQMTLNQVSAITSAQRSYLNEEQLDIIGSYYELNGGTNLLASWYMYTIFTTIVVIIRPQCIHINL